MLMLIARYRVQTAVLLAIGGFVVSWVLIHHGWFTHKLMEDTTVYAHYAAEMKRGLVPYLNFKFEYPPLALPLFLIPGWLAGPPRPCWRASPTRCPDRRPPAPPRSRIRNRFPR